MTRAAAVLALVGAAISSYLTWAHYADAQPFCTGISDCVRVQTSDYAMLAGVPVALIGLAGYLAVLGSLALPGENGRLATAFLALVGLGFSGYLTYVELAVLHAICQWCVASALVMTALAGVSLARVLRPPARPLPAGAPRGTEPPKGIPGSVGDGTPRAGMPARSSAR